MRLTEDGYKIGLVGEEQWRMFNEKREAIEREIQRLKTTWYTPQKLAEEEQLRVFGQNSAAKPTCTTSCAVRTSTTPR